MQEDKEYSQRTHVLHKEQVEVEETSTQRAPIGKLVVHHLMRHEPTNKDTSQEADNRQEYLTCYEVEPVEKRLADERKTIDSP